MGEIVAISASLAADDKRRLIKAAQDELVAAHLIDLRDMLTDADALVWYDEFLPQARDTKLIAGVLEIELSIRRGERLEQDGEQPGDDATQQGRRQANRSKDRLLADQKSAVRTYAANSLKQDRTPTKQGALRIAHLARARAEKKRAAPRGSRLYQALDRLAAQGRALTDSEIHGLTGMSAMYLHHVTFPWLRRTKSAYGTQFIIDAELRDICEGKRPRPQLNGTSLAEQLRWLQSEIKRRRNERALYVKRNNWDHLTSHAKFIIELMDWLEGELERVSTLL